MKSRQLIYFVLNVSAIVCIAGAVYLIASDLIRNKKPEPLTSKELREYQKYTEEELDTIRDRQDRMFQELTKRGSDIKW
jgi:hypothetical protein